MNNKGLTKTIFAVGLIVAIVLSSLLSYGITTTQFAVGTRSLSRVIQARKDQKEIQVSLEQQERLELAGTKWSNRC